MVNLLWTGGWDSTFRLLQLAQKGAEVQPHYIRDQHRESGKKELQVMNEIRQKVNQRFPNCIIRETEIINKSDIVINTNLERSYQNLLIKAWVGPQYIYIASYSQQHKIMCLELCLERMSHDRHVVMPCVENTELNREGQRIISENVDKDILYLFGQFSFPTLAFTKLDMLNESKKHGVFDILNMSWFCHRPLFGKPCGTCNPCMSTLKYGLNYRFNILALLRNKTKKMLLSRPRLHMLLRKLRYGYSDYS